MKLSSRKELMIEAEKELQRIRMTIHESSDERKVVSFLNKQIEKINDKATKQLHSDLDRRLAEFEKKMKREQEMLEKEKKRFKKEMQREPKPEELSWYQRRLNLIKAPDFDPNNMWYTHFFGPIGVLLSMLPGIYVVKNDPNDPSVQTVTNPRTGFTMTSKEYEEKYGEYSTTPSKSFWRVLSSLLSM